MTQSQSPHKIGLAGTSAFAVGSVGTGIYSAVPGILLLFYLTQILGIAVSTASLVVLVPKLAVIALDPLIGSWSDGLKTRWGRRRPFLLAGTITSGFTFVALFSVDPGGSEAFTALIIGLVYFLAVLSYSMFAVPYSAMPAELVSDEAAQARLVAARMIFVFVGVLLGASLAPILIERFGGDRDAYRSMAVILALASSLSMLITAALSPQAPDPEGSEGSSLFDQIPKLVGFIPYRLALVSYLLAITATGAATAAVPYFVSFHLDRPGGLVGTLFAAQLGVSILCMAVWARLSGGIGPAKALVASCILACAGSLGFLLAQSSSSITTLVLIAGFAGMGSSGVQVAAFSLLAMITRQLNVVLGQRVEGMATACGPERRKWA